MARRKYTRDQTISKLKAEIAALKQSGEADTDTASETDIESLMARFRAVLTDCRARQLKEEREALLRMTDFAP